MKTTELQINDWVMYRGNPRRITGLDESSVFFEKYCTECHKAVSVGGIPLTHEFFERNGFEKCVAKYAYGLITERGSSLIVWFDELDKKRVQVSDFELNDVPACFPKMYFVHQFQQVIRMLGIEKDIEV